MKRKGLFLATVAVVTVLGCEQGSHPNAPQVGPPTAQLAKIEKQFLQREREYLAARDKRSTPSRLASSNCDPQELHVPGDYATITGAVNAACAGSGIIVHVEGSPYNEVVWVSQNNLRIVASGDVTLNGTFIVQSSGVRIEQFNFNIPSSPNIAVWAYSTARDLEVLNNRFNGSSSRYGVVLNVGSQDCLIEKNRGDGLAMGILASGQGHTLVRNEFRGSAFKGIQLFANSSLLVGNTSSSSVLAGIGVNGANNVLERNRCTLNGTHGIDVQSGPNTIGPGNVSNFNQGYGISLISQTGGNTVTGNWFQCNKSGPIFDQSPGNSIFENITTSSDCD